MYATFPYAYVSVNVCDFPPFIAHSDVSYDNTTANYSCEAGHRFLDGTVTKTIVCDSTTWRWQPDVECSRKIDDSFFVEIAMRVASGFANMRISTCMLRIIVMIWLTEICKCCIFYVLVVLPSSMITW